jgi:hypothetical protein
MKRTISTIILAISFFSGIAGNATILPNPAINKFEIRVNDNKPVRAIEIYNYLGIKVKVLNHDHFLLNKIDVANLPTGRYFVKVLYANNSTELVQLIKK